MNQRDGIDLLTKVVGVRDLEVRTPSGAHIRLQGDDPIGEARAEIDRALKGRAVSPVVVVVGVGGGFLVDELQRRRPDVRILALELLPAIVKEWRDQPQVRAAVASGRLVLAVDPDYEMAVPSWPIAALSEAPIIVVHQLLAQHFPEARDRARHALKQFLYEQRANLEARTRLAGLYFDHTIDNLPEWMSACDVGALDGIAEGEPLVLIGAGPSLDRLLPLLRSHRERAWYVALDTSLRPLMQAGIVPDLVVSVDPTPLNGRHLSNLCTRQRPWLVAEMSVDPRSVNTFANRTFLSTIGRADPWPWLEAAGAVPTKLKVWGSVLTASCDLFTRMKAGRVIFAGMDLAYTNGQPYCRGTAFEEDWEAQRVRDALPSIDAVWATRIAEIAVQETDLAGRQVRTAPQMIAFRNWVRSVVAATNGTRFINVCESGILHGAGIEQRPLAEALPGTLRRVAAEQRLQNVATPAFDAAVPAVIKLLESTLSSDDDPVWSGWRESIPSFNHEQTRRRLAHAATRLRGRQGARAVRTTDTGWIDVPYDPTNFQAKAPLQWKVREQDVTTFAYRVLGKTMTLSLKINHSALVGMPSTELYVKIPDHYLPNRTMANPVWLASRAGKESGYITVHPGFDKAVVLRTTEGHFPIDPREFFVFGQVTFEVQ
jgi:hypothetical protein